MNEAMYRLTETERTDEEGRVRRVYGIALTEKASERHAAEMEELAGGAFALPDLGCDRDAVGAFVDRCNRCRLSLCHLFDAAEDFVNGGK